ncbi:DUF7606 domain-containing protein [Vandammella animalimorsus]|uniref:ACP-like domain-containing protein n=1 Tax=Vandammella animalimorsus TaxID=2029117 RepID=UPI001EED6E5B|nr:hypothetical protein [Vandammella animalimorsus]
MKLIQTAVAASLACLSLSAIASGHSVTYACEGGKQVQVRYQFNKAGIPTRAEAHIRGAKRVMAYDMNRSDDVDTFFANKSGYRLSSDYMDAKNFRKSSIMITAPNDEILFKSCTAQSGASSSGRNAGGSQNTLQVAYTCNNGRLSVAYQFNSAGIPVSATAQLQGKRRTLNYDLNNSSNVETFFTAQGYRLATDGMTRDNFQSLPIMVTAPGNKILHKSCTPN